MGEDKEIFLVKFEKESYNFYVFSHIAIGWYIGFAVPFSAPSGDVCYFYYPDSISKSIVGEKRIVKLPDNPEGKADKIIREFVLGPSRYASVNPFPYGTKVRAVWLVKDTLYVDFNYKLVKGKLRLGVDLPIKTSLVETVKANLPFVRKIVIMVEGRKIDTISGFLDAKNPFFVGGGKR